MRLSISHRLKVDHLNVGVAQAYLNQKRLDLEAKNLNTNANNFNKQTQQWLQLIENFTSSLKVCMTCVYAYDSRLIYPLLMSANIQFFCLQNCWRTFLQATCSKSKKRLDQTIFKSFQVLTSAFNDRNLATSRTGRRLSRKTCGRLRQR